jgi:predicted metal-dependent RNase
VGRSAVLAEGEENVLLDCGIGFKENSYPEIDDVTARNLDRVVLSHAHLDHSGYAPALYAAGYSGKTTMTKPTRDLVQLLLADFLRLQEKSGKPKAYSDRDVHKLLTNCELLEYNEWMGRRARVRFQEAGHILGSAITELEMNGKKIIYSGDINLRPSRLLEGAVTELNGDVLILESTYGGKSDSHAASKDVGRGFIEKIQKTLDKHGKIIVPTFAIGRGQEILFTLESYMKSGQLTKAPIYLDGMVKKVLKIYRHNAIYLKKEIQRRILTSDDDPFKSEHYVVPAAKDRSDVLAQEKAIIVTTSGMLNGGPVLTYLEKLGGEKRNKLILVGYQAEGTRGRALLEGAREIEIHDKKIELKLEVEVAPFTAHSDHRELVKFAKGIRGLRKCFIVHGEGSKPFELAEAIEEATKGRVKCEVPGLGESFQV